MNDIFGSMFNQRAQTQRPVHTSNITIQIGVLSSFIGGKQNLTYRRQSKCEPCNGTGGEKITCNGCNGSGMVIRQMGSGMFVQIMQTACDSCSGRGFNFKEKCFVCNGNSSTTEMKSVEINLPHGIDNGQFVRLQGMGDYRNGVFGDLIVRLNVEPQDGFDKVENHLIYNAFLNMDDLKNGSLLVPHPDGELTLKLPKVVDTSRPLRVKSKGFKLDTVGDLMVNQYVKFERD
jgi:molecular chaperone DnaJ